MKNLQGEGERDSRSDRRRKWNRPSPCCLLASHFRSSCAFSPPSEWVPAKCRTSHPFAVSGECRLHRRLSLDSPASLETLSWEPQRVPFFAQPINCRTWQAALDFTFHVQQLSPSRGLTRVG